MNHLLFLDFDGVLHPSSADSDGYFSRVELLERALECVQCELVISSSWRHHHSLSALKRMLPANLRSLVRGSTGQPFIGRWPRYNEILSYLRLQRNVPHWRALDDSWIEFPQNCSELIVCNPNIGFSAVQQEQLMAWFKLTRAAAD